MKLHFTQKGNGFPLLILHGLFGSADNWTTLGKHFAESFSTYLIDQRNHGRSPHADETTYPLMAQDLVELIDSEKIETCHLIGHSMGGKTVMEFALTYPEKVQKLIVADISPVAYPPHHQEILQAIRSLNLSVLTRREEADLHLQTLIPDFGVRQFILKNLARTPEGSFEWRMNFPGLEASYEAILGNIRQDRVFNGQVLFIRGEKSDYILPKYEPSIYQLFPNASIVTIPGAGHWVHAEAPALFFQTVLSFLNS